MIQNLRKQQNRLMTVGAEFLKKKKKVNKTDKPQSRLVKKKGGKIQ